MMKCNLRSFSMWLTGLATAALLGSSVQAAMVAHYTFDETSGTVLFDSVGTADAEWQAASGLTWQPTNGVIGGAADLSGGTDQYFRIPGSADPLPNATWFTISAWVNTDEDGSYKGIFQTRDPSENQPWGLFKNGARQADARIRGQGVTLDRIDADSGWQHVAMTWVNGSAQKVYVDGVEKTAGDAATFSINSGNSWVIGEDTCCGGREWNGQFDDFAMWDTALSYEEIYALYQAGLSGTDAGSADLSSLGAVIIDQPEDFELLLGSTDEISFGVSAIGLPAPTYQWRKDGANLGGEATGAMYFISPPTSQANMGDYDCVVSNPNGLVTSEVVNVVYTVNDITPPIQSAKIGDANVEFSIPMPTGVTYTYQWYKDGVELTGQTASNIVIATVGGGDIGDYTVGVTFGSVTVTSDPAPLTLTLSGLQTGMFGYWTFDETNGTTAVDSVGQNDAEYQASNNGWVEGMIGGAADMPSTGNSDIFSVASIPQMTGASQMTWSVWIDLDDDINWAGIIDGRGMNAGEVWGLWTPTSGGNSTIQNRINNNGIGGPATLLNDGGWYHVVVTMDGVSGNRVLYYDGQAVATNNVTWPAITSSGSIVFGRDTCCGGRVFNGQFDDFAMWDRALSATEVAAIYEGAICAGLGAIDVPDPHGPAAVLCQPMDSLQTFGDLDATNTFEVTAVGPEPITYQWRTNGMDVVGAINPTLELGPTAPSIEIDCVVSNGQGSDTSDVVKVANVLPPVEPASQTLTVGDIGQFAIGMPTNNPAYTYQWYQGASMVPGATSDAIVFSPAALSDAGDYTVEVTYNGETLVSSVGTLSVSDLRITSVGNADDTTLLQNYDTGNSTNTQFTANYGGRDQVIVGDTDSPDTHRTGLIRFDVTGLDGAITSVSNATLRLTKVGGDLTHSHTVQVFRVTEANQAWVEGTLNGTAEDGSACFAQAQLGTPGVDWAGGFGFGSPGVDYYVDVLGQLVLDGSSANQAYDIPLNPSAFTLDDMILDQWVAGNNAGLRIRDLRDAAGSGDAEQVFFSSSEGASPPALILAYAEASSAPFVTLHPEDYEMTISAGDTVTFEVLAVGSQPLSYQWRYQGANIAGATSSTLVLDPAANNDAGDYDCVVSNAIGTTTSDAATLSLVLPPVTPATRSMVAGGTAQFSVDVSEAGNTFDWKLDGVSLGAPSANTLTLTDVASDDAGDYTVTVTTPDPVVIDSSAGVLTVVVGGAGGIQAGMIGHWPLDEASGRLAKDQIKSQDGVWANSTEEGLNWVTGIIGGAADLTTAGSAWFDLPDLTDLATASGFTISLWMQPDGKTSYQGLFTTRGPGNQTANWGMNYEGNNVDAMRTDNRIPTASGDNAGSVGVDSSNIIVGNTTNWYHCVMTYSLNNGGCVVYINGAEVSTGVSAFPTNIATTLWKIGLDRNNAGRDFDGILDDIALWTRPLSIGEVEAIYAEGVNGVSVIDITDGAVPVLTQIAILPTGEVELTWESESGYSYNVVSADDLVGDNWMTIATGLPATPPENVYETGMASLDVESFRVEAVPPPAILEDDFEPGSTNVWTVVDDGSSSQWELGTPNLSNARVTLTSANSGVNCYGTDLDGDTIEFNPRLFYRLRSPVVSLVGVDSATLQFSHFIDAEGPQPSDSEIWGDWGQINILDAADPDGAPMVVERLRDRRYQGSSSGWADDTLELPPEALNREVIIEFNYRSDVLDAWGGWYIDDVSIR